VHRHSESGEVELNAAASKHLGMKINVLFFSVLRDIAGTDQIPVELPPGAKVSDLLNEMFERWPKLKDWDASLLIAVDQTYAKRDTTLQNGAEVAIMPPVQGG
jgi:molybdopterin synthase sulfur carrier subunit